VVKRLAFFGLALLALTGCATMQDVIDDKSQGTMRAYAVTKDQAYEAAARILRSDPGFANLEQDRERGFILGSFNGSLGFLGVWVEPASASETNVTAVLKTRTPFPAMTESGFHERLANAVGAERPSGSR
jgi:hypothetical protein